MIKFRSSAKFDKSASIIFINKVQFQKKLFTPFRHKPLIDALRLLHKTGQFRAEPGELFPLLLEKQSVLVVGMGQKDEVTLTSLRIAARKAILSSFLLAAKEIEVIAPEQKDPVVNALIEGFLLGAYGWNKYRSEEKTSPFVAADKKIIHLVAAKKSTYSDTQTICDGVNFTRDLINDNADLTTSVYLEKKIKDLTKGKKNVAVEILNKKQLETLGLNLHLAVNQGSRKEPKLIIVKYTGSLNKGNYTAIVGKGMTFDSGGLNLKPTGSIESMRCDMSGAAAVIGTLKNTLSLRLKKNIIFAVGLAENAIGSDSYKPGEVIKSYSGKTVEIGNTDAEGRLVLADAISYIVKNYKPARIIDIATLTGACVVALGHDYTGLVASDDKLAGHLLQASQKTDDRIWRLPSYPELKDYVKSRIADIRNLGLPRGAAGTLTAAEFLRQFTDNTPWAHLDIAGTAFTEGKGRAYYGYGATGAGVRLLTEFLMRN